ncbi:hypothetical protein G7054_g12615 [Neopestalotiopsis clavispora]|nr:hypothetical protein G7054_g12615 [Neopestalotiopsis clavispora]
MASYHRVLDTFDRSVSLKSVECDYDIHPWDLLVDGSRWDGKIRLIGFVDVFFLICYSGESRFEKGIIIYKNDDAIRNTLDAAKVLAEDLKLEVVNQAEIDAAKTKEQVPIPLERYFNLHSITGGLDYTITSLGHEIGLKTRYEKAALKKYEIKIRKGNDFTMKSIITHAELIGHVIGSTIGGTTMEDVGFKYLEAITGSKGSRNVALAADR